MISLLPEPSRHEPQITKQEDPRTSMREVQAQDVLIWSRSVYESFRSRIKEDPKDKQAIDWFTSSQDSGLAFLNICSIFGMSASEILEELNIRRKHE